MRKKVLAVLLAASMAMQVCVPLQASEGFTSAFTDEQAESGTNQETQDEIELFGDGAESVFEDCEEYDSVVELPDDGTALNENTFLMLEPLTEEQLQNANGQCGENVLWEIGEIEGGYSLIISGSGDMYDGSPWKEYSKYITSVEIVEGVTCIGNGAFFGCSNMQNIKIPKSVARISGFAFGECSSLQSIEIPDGVTDIGEEGTFWKCSSLTSIEIPQGVTKIAPRTFWFCSGLQTIKVPETVLNIGEQAFGGCSSLMTINIPDGITNIEEQTFVSCYSLDNVEIPYGVTNIGNSAFNRCESLRNIKIPGTVKNIGPAAFFYCNSLENIEISNGVVNIGNSAFMGCRSVEKIEIPKGVASIGEKVFCQCDSLKEVYFYGNAPMFDNNAFLLQAAVVYYPELNASWDKVVRNSLGGALTWEKWNPYGDFDDEFEYTDGPSSIYNAEEWKFWMNKSHRILKLTANPEIFRHVLYIEANDDTTFGRFEYLFANAVDIGKGWRELLTENTSKQETEKILLALLYECDDSLNELTTAKTGKTFANMFVKSLDGYLKSKAHDSYIVDKIYNLASSEQFQSVLVGQGYDKSMEMLLSYVDDIAPEDKVKLSNTFESFKTSKTLTKGLNALGIGLDILDLAKVSLNTYNKLLQMQYSNAFYTELLSYIGQNSKKQVIRDAAYSLLDKLVVSEETALKQLQLEVLKNEGVDLAFKYIIKQIPFMNAVKFGADTANELSNIWFHTTDIVKLKSTMRIAAYLGESIADWTTEKYNKALWNFDVTEAEATLYGLEYLCKVRIIGEKALKTCASYIGDEYAIESTAETIPWLESKLDTIQAIRDEEMRVLKASCPVDVEIYDTNNNLVLTVYDGQETSGCQNGIRYYVYYNPCEDDYIKTVVMPKNAGYTYKIKGNDLGKVSCTLSEMDENNEIVTTVFENTNIDAQTNILINPTNDVQNATYKIVSMDSVTEEKNFIKKDNTTDQILVTSIVFKNQNTVKMQPGERVLLDYEILPVNATNKETILESSDTGVATVNGDGVVCAMAEGKATITVSTLGKDVSTTCEIVVEDDSIPEEPTSPIDPPIHIPTPIPLPDNYPDGSCEQPDGSIKTPDGTVIGKDGTITLPDGTVLTPDADGNKPTIDKDNTVTDTNGVKIYKDGTIVLPGEDRASEEDDTTIGKNTGDKRPVYKPDSVTVITEEGNKIILPSGKEITPPAGSVVQINGTVTEPDGTVTTPDGTTTKPDGTVITPDGTQNKPDGTVIDPDGTTHNPDGSIQAPDGSYRKPAKAMIKTVNVTGNTAQTVLEAECAGAKGYDFVIGKKKDMLKTKDYYKVNKNQLTTDTFMYYLPKGTYYAACHAWTRGADDKKVFGSWSELKELKITAATPAKPKITKVQMKGSNVYITYTKCKNATGYDIVLGSELKRVNGEKRPVQYGKLVRKITKGNVVTAVFKNVKKGTYYAGLHAYNRTSENKKKVFSPWSDAKKIKVK